MNIELAVDWLRMHASGLIGAALLLLGGWIVARLTRRAIGRAVAATDQGHAGAWSRLFELAGRFVYWAILIAFAMVAVEAARSTASQGWLMRIGEYVPHLLVGALILIGGALLGLLARDLTLRSMSSLGVAQAQLFARIVQTVVVVTAFVVGIDQLGIRTTFLITMISIAAGGLVLAVSLAFAIGATGLVRNLVGARDARHYYHSGQRVQIGSIEGEIVEISPTTFVLSTGRGRVTVPARAFHDEAITLLSVDNKHG